MRVVLDLLWLFAKNRHLHLFAADSVALLEEVHKTILNLLVQRSWFSTPAAMRAVFHHSIATSLGVVCGQISRGRAKDLVNAYPLLYHMCDSMEVGFGPGREEPVPHRSSPVSWIECSCVELHRCH